MGLYADVPLRPYGINLRTYPTGKIELQLNFSSKNLPSLQGIRADIHFITIFEEEIVVKNLAFTKIENRNTDYYTEFIHAEIPSDIFEIILCAHVKIQRYIEDEQVVIVDSNITISEYDIKTLEKTRQLYGMDIITKYQMNENHWICLCGNINNIENKCCHFCGREVHTNTGLSDIIKAADGLGSAREIYNYLQGYNQIIDDEVMNEIREVAGFESMYGNAKSSCMKVLNKLSP